MQQIELISGLSADTPLLIDQDVKSIRSLYLQTGVSPTFAFNDNANIVSSNIQGVPQEVFVNDLYNISFSNGFYMTCTPTTAILGVNGYRYASDLIEEEAILGAIYNHETGNIINEIFTVDHVSKSYKMIAEPVYYFLSEHCNILLPHYTPDNNIISFICVHQ